MRNFYGHRYEQTKHLNNTELFALIRKEFKALARLWNVDISVRKNHYNSVSVSVKAIGWNPFSQEYTDLIIKHLGSEDKYAAQKEWSQLRPWGTDYNQYNEFANKIFDILKADLESYNYDGSDIQSDYFDVRFHNNLSWDWEYIRDLEANKDIASLPLSVENALPKAKKVQVSKNFSDYGIVQADLISSINQTLVSYYNRTWKSATVAGILSGLKEAYPKVPSVVFKTLVENLVKEFKAEKGISGQCRKAGSKSVKNRRW